MTLYYDVLESPVGELLVAVDDEGALKRLSFLATATPGSELEKLGGEVEESPRRCAAVKRQLDQYFAGKLKAFDLEVRPDGSAFERRVWRELEKIPFGSTASYGDIARRLGRPGAARAVGRANARNPVAIVVPCHRVIGADGRLTGFGGGIPVKRHLLELEGVLRRRRHSRDGGARALTTAPRPDRK